MFEFAHPFWLLLLPLIGICAWFVYGRRIQHGLRFGPVNCFPHKQHTWRTHTAILLPAVFLAALALIVLAMARPRSLLSTSRRTADVIAIQMVLDVSGSMEALDFSTAGPLGTRYRSRLDVVKDTFAEFIKRRPDDLIGLISFAGYASTLAPLTSDHDALLHILSGVEIPRLQFDASGNAMNSDEQMTAIGDALASACARLQDTEPESKIIVLLSDGDSNAGIIEPQTALETARRMGIKLYTIGIGSEGRAPYRTVDALGREIIRYAWVEFDEALLHRLAAETGGVYYNVRDTKGLENALESINRLETTRVEQHVIRQYDERHTRYTASALLLVLLVLTLNISITRRLL